MTVAASVDEFLTESFRHHAESGRDVLVVSLGGMVFELSACCVETLDVLRWHFDFLEVSMAPQIRCRIVDEVHSVSRSPRVGWQWSSSHYLDSFGSAVFLDYLSALVVHDADLRRFAIISRQVSAQDLKRREILRALLQPIFSMLGIDMIHGATLGNSSVGVLLAGRGGSGKSTLVSAGVRHGWATTGDDFLLLNTGISPETTPRVHAAFQTAKLVPGGPESEGYRNLFSAADGKNVVSLNQDERAVISSQEIVALVALEIGDRPSLDQIELREFLAALLPFSAPLTFEPVRLVRFVQQRWSHLPVFRVASGPSRQETLHILKGLLPQ